MLYTKNTASVTVVTLLQQHQKIVQFIAISQSTEFQMVKSLCLKSAIHIKPTGLIPLYNSLLLWHVFYVVIG